MIYADTDLWIALLKDDDWLADEAAAAVAEHRGDLAVSLATFVELFLIEERYDFDREAAITSILELAHYDGDADALYRASANRDDGLTTFDAFHAALADDAILSSDDAFDATALRRIPLERAGANDG